jgi:hypothetical protein
MKTIIILIVCSLIKQTTFFVNGNLLDSTIKYHILTPARILYKEVHVFLSSKTMRHEQFW